MIFVRCGLKHLSQFTQKIWAHPRASWFFFTKVQEEGCVVVIPMNMALRSQCSFYAVALDCNNDSRRGCSVCIYLGFMIFFWGGGLKIISPKSHNIKALSQPLPFRSCTFRIVCLWTLCSWTLLRHIYYMSSCAKKSNIFWRVLLMDRGGFKSESKYLF